MHYNNKLHHLFFFFCILFFSESTFLFAQEAAPAFLSKTQWLNERDLKKWNDNLSLILEGSQLISKSNALYLQMSATSEDASIEEDKKEKLVRKLENEAVEKSRQALINYQMGYSGLMFIISQYIGVNEEKHPAYKDMVNSNARASEFYQNAGKAQTDSERQQLTSANEMQLQAIEKGIAIFTIQPYEYSGEDIVTDGEAAPSEEIQIDADFYRKYKEYISNNSIPDPITINRLMQIEGDDSNFQSFLEIWYKYLYMSFDDLNQEDLASLNQLGITDSIAYDSVMEQITLQANLGGTRNIKGEKQVLSTNEISTNLTQRTKTENSSENNTITGSQNKDETSEELDRKKFISDKAEAQKIASELLSAEVYNASLPDLTDSYEFRVQVAASRVQLSLPQLKAMYNGKFSVTEIKEGNYFKYQVRGFMLYTDAQKVCSQTGVDNAYITSYKSNNSVPLGLAVKDVRSLESRALKYGKYSTINPIEFSVQLLASRVRLSEERFNRIYSGQWPITIVFEGGWYKYQILCRSDLQLALNVVENSGVDKAFLIGYKYGQRMELFKALHEYKTYKP